MANSFKAGELVIYKCGTRVELGKIKSVKGLVAFVWFSEGDTAARCDVADLYHLSNAHMIRDTGFGKPRTWKDDPATDKQKAYIRAMQEYCIYRIPAFDFENGTKGQASEYIEKYSKMAHETAYGLENEDLYGDRD